ncbi:G-type lectin S-receptor-like serine/threonine-protein kinase At1g34300 [Selaginella moellendorffii]|uniref:G-type lectin S-receptor-like serine/threonine-protein kinase At1g34300 n=1 Tax=Selaginella moellendorffii TaxID=88036 RepID=UPI000D1C7369|nr:G-type lectin S-receptor-like serine/threonine-protein kinase At1g34300 [Selaginella moellendorffii]|eukprot:XP_024525948.1 G-type lectin S-receptor-like serine/threonine-protein kinase At1g34300 [Selaginella moellendorffii]
MPLLLLFLASALVVLANGKSSLQVGDVLAVNQFLVSPDNTFELGFVDDEASGAPSVAFTANARLQLTAQGLFVSDGAQLITIANVPSVASAELQDNGNFVVISSSGSWQSFDVPTDTLLTGQLIQGNKDILRSGSFSLYLNQNSIGLKSYAVPESNSQSYWDVQRSPTSSNNASTLVMNSTGILTFTDGQGPWYINREQNSYFYVLDFGTPKVARRLTLERNGTLRVYSLTQDNSSWNIVWQALTADCKVFGMCGPFGICTYRPGLVCTCPPGFHFVDPGDHSKGCEYNVPLKSCNGSDNRWVRLERTDYTYNDKTYISVISLEDCKSICKENCGCLGIAYRADGSGQCFLKGPDSTRGPKQVIYNGFQIASGQNLFFLKISASDTSVPAEDDHSLNQLLYVTDMDATNNMETLFVKEVEVPIKHKLAVALAIAELVVFLICGAVYGHHVKEKVRHIKQQMEVEGGATRFTYHQLEIATNFFKDKLGTGGFGTVFKGLLPDGIIVAVKNIEMEIQAEKQFQAEVTTLGKIHHINLVRLLGYCAEGSHRLLVYEYMQNGSLEKSIISNEDIDESLCDWKTRFSIAVGIARGITYLHEQCQECIVHCDIKPQNILLDEKFCPKVSDFGLAKLASRERTINVTTVQGTRGYMAPEWVRNVTITPKVDVYSYGMVLFELLSGGKIIPVDGAPATNSERGHFPIWAFQHYVAGSVSSIADTKMAEKIDMVQFNMVLRVAFWCVQPDASLRPNMSKVVEMLEENVPVPEPPFPRMIE